VTIHAYTDGASRGNPGESGIGVLLKDEHGATIFSSSRYIGKATNNVAEYEALLCCLSAVADRECKKLIVHSDSELMVRQIQGSYRVRDKNLQKYYQKVYGCLQNAPFEFTIVHIDRGLNREADRLANQAIDSRAIRAAH
jgi:ribonuclease HI